uniref:Ribonuclease HII n=1 Tax=Lygus hesperus TaxID=30085 RepID=A0A0A9YFF1_LYGHE
MNNVEVTPYIHRVLTVQPKIGPMIQIPARTHRRSWCCDSDPDLASDWLNETCVTRRAFAANIKEIRRRVISLGSEPEQTCTCCVSRLQISEIDVRRIVKEILDGVRRSPEQLTRFPRTRVVSCSSGSSGCSSSPCSPGYVSDLQEPRDGMYRQRQVSTCSSVSSVYSLEPKFGHCQNNPYPTDFLPEVHSSPTKDCRSNKIVQFDCRTPLNWFPYHSTVTNYNWSSTIGQCPKCIPTFDKDSLNSTLSTDSLNDMSIFSLDSLNSLTDKDSLEYAHTTFSDDSLDSLDSCCNYDSLSDSKDSGFFSCSLPAVCSR